jgi:fructosamine-3-kinase
MVDLEELKTLTGLDFKSISSAGSSQWAEFYRLETPTQSLFLKQNSGGADNELEAWMLQKLRDAGMPTPEIVFCDTQCLIMEYVEGNTHLSGSAEMHAARLLAELHSHTDQSFGLEKPTVIGSLEQPNDRSESWAEFFGRQRLVYSADKAFQENRIDAQMRSRIEKLAENIEDFLTGEEKPSLVHGDMWGGNLIASGNEVKALIDPAIYYAEAETELAFATLFGCFGRDFFDAYNEIRPIKPGFFETRRYLYNIYPLLVHVRLFGRSYLAQLDSCLMALGV